MGETSSETNLIDFSFEDLPVDDCKANEMLQQKIQGNTPSPDDPSSTSNPQHVTASAQMTSPVKANKSSKSFFEITRVETGSQGEGKGDDIDSELDDTVSEAFDTSRDTSGSSTPLPSLDNSAGSIENDNTVKTKPPLTQRTSTVTSSTTSGTTSTEANPTSRFRIVKIAKPTPYDRGRWKCKDNDQESKTTTTDNSHSKTENNSPTVSTTRANVDENADRSRVVSPNELRKGTSSELLSHPSQQQATNVNRDLGGARRQSNDSVSATTSEPTRADTTQVVDALEAAFEQIQTIKESLMRTAVDEWKTLRSTLHMKEGDNDHLKKENRLLREENELLKARLKTLEERLEAKNC